LNRLDDLRGKSVGFLFAEAPLISALPPAILRPDRWCAIEPPVNNDPNRWPTFPGDFRDRFRP